MISSASGSKVSHLSEIIEGKLYLGDRYSPTQSRTLSQLGITHILNVTSNITYQQKRKITYLRISIDDGDEGISKEHFEKAIRFIEQGDVVLVHCKEGISRSASMVIAYLMRQNHWDFNDTLEFVKSKRRVVSPHFRFQVELIQHEKNALVHKRKRQEADSEKDESQTDIQQKRRKH